MGGSKGASTQNGATSAPSTSLTRSISMCNIAKTTKLRQACQSDVHPGESPFYLRYFNTMTTYMVILPPLLVMVKVIREKLQKLLFDDFIWNTLQRANIINWCPTTKPLYPKWTRGDGNCLLHAVSLYLWGIHDDPLFLRGLVHQALCEDESREDLRRRWKREKLYWNSTIPEGGLQLDSEEWDREWALVVDLARDERQDDSPNTLPYRSLEEIHIFVLANIIRRPIIVLAEHVIRNIQGSSLAPNHVGGVYLPTLCHSDDCVKSPVVLCYESNHFVPLLSMEDAPCTSPLAERAVHAVPLVTEKLEILPVHFLSESEESQVYELFKKYLDLVELPWTKSDSVSEVLAARTHLNRLPDEMNLTDDYYKHIERICKEERNSSERSKESDKIMNRGPLFDTSMEEHPQERKIANATTEEQDQIFDFYLNNMGDLLTVRDASRPSTAAGSSRVRDGGTSPQTRERKEQDLPLSVVVEQWKSQESTECVTEDCKYFGLPESGGRCSKCVLDYTIKVQPEKLGVAEAKIPSAPVKRTSSFQGINRSFSDEVRTGFADISPIEDQKCLYPSCYLRSSRTTSPYCVRHKDKGTIVSRRQHDKERDVASYYARQTLDTSGEGRCESSSLESIVSQFPKMCIIPLCREHGDQKSENMCALHYTASSVKGDRNSLPTDYRREVHDPPDYEQRLCNNKRCARMGEPGLQGYCDDCYRNLDITQNLQNEQKLKMMKATPLRSSAERPKSWAVPKTSYGEKLLENQDKEMSPAPGKPADKDVTIRDPKKTVKRHYVETKLKVSNLGQTEPVKSPKRTSRKHEWREPSDPTPDMNDPDIEPLQKCTKPGCSGIQTLKHSGLCWPCVKESLKPTPPKSPSQLPAPGSKESPSTSSLYVERSSISSEPLGKVPLYRETTLIRELSQRRQNPYTTQTGPINNGGNLPNSSAYLDPSSGEESLPSSGERLSYTQELMHQPKCINPSCSSQGLEINKGLCQDCFNFLATKETVQSNWSSQVQHTPGELLMRKCVSPNCDMYGTPEREDYCSKCYTKYRTSRHPAAPGSSGHTSLLTQPTDSYFDTPGTSITAKPCSNHHCTRFGDPAFNGFCSACYEDYGYNFDVRLDTGRFSHGHTSCDYLPSRYTDPIRTDIKRCRNMRYTGCNNFSHLNCKGFCRGCYVAIRTNMH